MLDWNCAIAAKSRVRQPKTYMLSSVCPVRALNSNTERRKPQIGKNVSHRRSIRCANLQLKCSTVRVNVAQQW